MKKNILLLSFLLASIYTYSQKVTQKELMRSGLYYRYVAYDSDLSRAKEKARNGLLTIISEKEAGKYDKSVSKIYVNKIQFYVLKLIEDNKVIAYVLKDDISNNGKLKSLHTIEIVDAEKKKVNQDSIITTEKKRKTISLKTKEQDKKSSEDNYNNGENNKIKTTNTVIESLVACNTKEQLYKLITKLKREGKLQTVSKRYRETHTPEYFNIVIIDRETDEVIGFILKGTDKNIKNNKHFNKEDLKKYKQIWIRILQN